MPATDASPTFEAREVAREFLERYARALLDRDGEAIADFSAIPSLIEFSDASIPVADREQTASFFAGAFGQYEGVTSAEPSIDVLASGPHAIWADVSWRYDGAASGERNMYQLARRDGRWAMAVLTPLEA